MDPKLAAQVKGTWSGYVENFAFDDGSDAIELVLDAHGAGQIRFGAAPVLAPASDGNVGYPPSYHPAPPVNGSAGAGNGSDVLPLEVPAAGFEFSIRNVSLEKARLQFDVAALELWAAWCHLQTSFELTSNPGYYSCIQDWQVASDPAGCFLINPSNQQKAAVDCARLNLCEQHSVCSCSASGCAEQPSNVTHFDLALADSRADGSVAGLRDRQSGNRNLHNVHLTRQ